MTTARIRIGLVFFAALAVACIGLLVILGHMNATSAQAERQRALALANLVARNAAQAVALDDAQTARDALLALAGDPQIVRGALRGAGGQLLAWLPPDDRVGAEAMPEAGDGHLVVAVPILARSGHRGNLIAAFSGTSLAAVRRADFFVYALSTGVAVLVLGIFSLLAQSSLSRRRRAEEALHRCERNLRALIEAWPEAVLVHRHGRVVCGNPEAARLFSSGEQLSLSGRVVTDVVLGLPAIGVKSKEVKLPGKDGEVTVEVRTLPLVFDDGPAALTIAREVSELRRMQSQLLLTDRMASVGTLAAGVAHEINNPLSYVLANLGFAIGALRGKRKGVTDKELLEALDDAMQGGERVSRIVKDLKTFSRGDDQGKAPVSLQSALDLAVQMTASAMRGRVKLVKSYAEVPLVDANESRLGQVFVNLLINASQAIPDDDRPHLIEVSTQTDYAGRAVVSIRDNGKGIPPEALDHIFDPFFTTKPVGVGTGLGLSICHNIVSWLGGEIVVHSRVGMGTTFTITLPASKSLVAPVREVVAIPEKPAPSRRGRVLVVDDEPMVGQAVKRTLESEADVVCENSAQAALRRFVTGERYDVVLCDLMMPEMTGVELHDALEKIAPEQLERFVFVTGAITTGEGGILGLRRRPHLDKPFDGAGLRKVVREYVEMGRALRVG